MSVSILRGNALALPLADDSVDLVVTSPPYFGLRSYQDGGEHYAGQIGDEPTPAEFVDALIAATSEMMRVLKPSGSIWVNLGDKYVVERPCGNPGARRGTSGDQHVGVRDRLQNQARDYGLRTKSLVGIPWRYAIRCIDDLGLILRAEVIWAKPNGLPESVTDRVRRSHETWFHFTKEPRYFSAVDEIREGYSNTQGAQAWRTLKSRRAGEIPQYTAHVDQVIGQGHTGLNDRSDTNPLGKLPGSVWTIPTEPLHVPEHLGIDHFAAFPTEWPRRIIQGWSPSGICTECGEGRRPTTEAAPFVAKAFAAAQQDDGRSWHGGDPATRSLGIPAADRARTITGESCACPEPTAPTRPAVVLDPFSGTGTTAMVASALGRHGIGVDMSSDYCRLAQWRTTDPKQRAKAARVPYTPPREQVEGQEALWA